MIENEKLKRAAILLFGKDPIRFYPNVIVNRQILLTDSDLLSQELIEGNIFEMADTTTEILDKKYFKKIISYEGNHRIETPEYPNEAIREIVLNAIVHRQYTGAPIQISIYEDKFIVWN
ncbi:MAG: transcriptional regulator, partial [Bacteroidales bacterium]|nr:transcriptional regulator [Bacteroidales bacterium]